jgi:hypothetical protein
MAGRSHHYACHDGRYDAYQDSCKVNCRHFTLSVQNAFTSIQKRNIRYLVPTTAFPLHVEDHHHLFPYVAEIAAHTHSP